MRRPEYFLGDLENGGELNEDDFKQGLELVVEPDALPKAQLYDVLQGFVHWGLAGNRPDLALDAYEAYVEKAWVWQTKINKSERDKFSKLEDEYFNARYKKEEETGERHDGMAYFSLFDVTYFGGIDSRVQEDKKEGEGFRNLVLPQIITGLIEMGDVNTPYNFLMERRTAHGFRGYPRELNPTQCVDVHVATAQAILDINNNFAGNRAAAFKDIATFALEYAQFPQFGRFQIVPRLAPIREAMVALGLEDPWHIFAEELDYALKEFNEGGGEWVFNGIRRYLQATHEAGSEGELPDLRSLQEWPEHALESFDLVERNPSIPSSLASLLPALKHGKTRVSASDAFQSDPTLGTELIRAVAGNEESQERVTQIIESMPKALPPKELTKEEVLRFVTDQPYGPRNL